MKREEKTRLNDFIKELQNESNKRKDQDLKELRKPYYFKGRFNSLKDSQKREKIRQYYQQEKENTKREILDLLNCEELRSFQSCVEWSKNRTWGMNPHARTWINNSNFGEGSASGCGYDKLSASICYAVNNNENAKKIILGAVLKNYIKTGDPLPYGIYKTNKIYLHFDGCGVSTLQHILKYCGLNRQQWNETKTSDFISAEK